MQQNSPSIPDNLFSDTENSPKPFKDNKFKRAIYKMLFSKEKREAMSLEANQNLALRTAKNWRYMINQYFLGNLNQFNIKAKKDLGTEKIIWQYWGQGLDDKTLPEITKASFNSVDRYKGEYLVIRLDDDNISDYLDLPNFVWEKKGKNNYRFPFFSDLLRLALLDAYLQILNGNKVVEVKPNDYSKGTEAERLCAQNDYDFVLAIGDDVTDESMFRSLPNDAITVKVGFVSDDARYCLHKQEEVLPFLNELSKA